MFKELNILRLFFEDSNREFNVREVARILKLSPASVSSKLKDFAKKGILLENKERNYILYKANLDNELYRNLKVFYNIKKIRESRLIDKLNEFYLKPTIVLYGSFSKGLDVNESDIDLVVISENNKDFPYLKEFENKLKREIHIFSVKNLKNLRNEHLVDSVINGIVLQGILKWN
ncbi:MAG: ArsR family transcriptional regulator [Nanoarchaeota archaeon]